MEVSANHLPILISNDGIRERASLIYTPEEPEVLLKSSRLKLAEIQERIAEVNSEIIVDSTGRSISRDACGSVRIRLKPLIRVERNYFKKMGSVEPLYPPSSEGWLSRISRKGRISILMVHEIVDHDNLWLSIIDKATLKINESHQIKPFESGILEIPDESDERLSVFDSLRSLDDSEKWMDGILSQSPPSWKEIARIIENVYIPKLTLHGNAREVLEQIVPIEYDPMVRKQIMTFLALVTKWELPHKDPIDYFERLRPLRNLDALLTGYLNCVLSEEKPPPYVQIMQESVQLRLGRPSRPVKQAYEDDPWHLALHRIHERLPKTVATSVQYATRLNDSKEIVVGLPVFKEQAAKSRKLWSDRFRLMAEGFKIRCYPRPRALGLMRLLDITRAHQWPHRHMKWSAAIELDSYKHPHVQVMEMPPEAAEKVMSARHNIVPIVWSASAVNTQLYKDNTDEWRSPFATLIRSLDGRRSLRRLGNEFGIWKGRRIHEPERIWAKCMDVTGTLGFLTDFEQSDYLDYLGLSSEELYQTLKLLQAKSIIDITYSPTLPNLMTVAIVAQGASTQICSLARGFLKHTPSATVMLGKESTWLFILTRLPLPVAHHMMAAMPSAAEERNITLTYHRVSSFRSYTWGFYQRLLNDDASWDDDVSAMLSQIRVPYQEEQQEHN